MVLHRTCSKSPWGVEHLVVWLHALLCESRNWACLDVKNTLHRCGEELRQAPPPAGFRIFELWSDRDTDKQEGVEEKRVDIWQRRLPLCRRCWSAMSLACGSSVFPLFLAGSACRRGRETQGGVRKSAELTEFLKRRHREDAAGFQTRLWVSWAVLSIQDESQSGISICWWENVDYDANVLLKYKVEICLCRDKNIFLSVVINNITICLSSETSFKQTKAVCATLSPPLPSFLPKMCQSRVDYQSTPPPL